MIIKSENPLVFNDVQRMCEEVYGSDPKYDDAVLVLGYIVAKYSPDDLRRQYPNHRIIAYQLEQLFDGSPWANSKTYKWLDRCDEIWEYDLGNLEFTTKAGLKSIYRPMRYCECLKDIPAAETRDIDVLFYGYPTDRRREIMAYWMGFSWDKYYTVYATGVTGPKLRELLGRAKVVLNLHAYPANGFRQEQVRMFYPVINGICVVSETSQYNEFGKSIVEMDSHQIEKVLPAILSSGDWKTIGERAPEIYRKHCEDRR